MNESLGLALASLLVCGVLLAFLRSRVRVGRPAPSAASVPVRMAGYLGGCAVAALLLYVPFWLQGSLQEGRPPGYLILLLYWALGLGGALAGSLIALAAAAQPSTRTFWLAPAQGVAATLVPAWACARLTAGGLGFGPASLVLIGLAFLSAGACWFVYRVLARLFARGRPSAA